LPPDYLKACLALLAAEAPGSEQGLTCRLAAMGLAGTDCSAVRHALSAMKADGLMEVAVPRPAERTYHLTVVGTSWLRSWASAPSILTESVSGPLARTTAPRQSKTSKGLQISSRTPQARVLDGDRVLRYRGRVFDARDPARVHRRDLQEAVDDLLAHREVRVPETDAFGCSIVW
jgi:hypothetical protein